MVFTSLAFVQLARALASRSFSEPIWRTGLRGNLVLIGMLVAALAFQLAAVYLPFAQEIFGTTALTAGQLAVGAGLARAILALMETDKALRSRYTPSAPTAQDWPPTLPDPRQNRAVRRATRGAVPLDAGDGSNRRQQARARCLA